MPHHMIPDHSAQLHTGAAQNHTIPYHSYVVSRNLAVFLSGSSGWHTLIVIQTRSGSKLTDAETLYLVCYFFRLSYKTFFLHYLPYCLITGLTMGSY